MAKLLRFSRLAGSRWTLVAVLGASMAMLVWDYWLGLRLEWQVNETAQNVNLMGRQRMLSQAVVKNAALAVASSRMEAAAMSEMLAHAKLLVQTHAQLRPIWEQNLSPDRLAILDRAFGILGGAPALLQSARAEGQTLQPVLDRLATTVAQVIPLIDSAILNYASRRQDSIAVNRKYIDLLRGLLLCLALCAIVFQYLREMLARQREKQLEKEAAQATEELDEVSSWQHAILESAGFAIIATGENGMIKTFNRAAEVMLGYDAGDLVGIATPAAFHVPEEIEERAQELSHEFGIKIEPGFTVFVHRANLNLPHEREWTYVRKDGSGFPVLLTVTALRRGDGSVRGYLGMAVDITDRKKAEHQLRAATEKAEKATRAKGEFLANISHEIRTPLNGVIGFAQLLDNDELPPQHREYVSIIRGSAESLLVIINDILDFSKIEAGKLEVEAVPLDFRKLLAEVLALMAPRVEGERKELIVEWSPGTPEFVKGDPGRVRQVLINLIGNAIKFTPEGYVLVKVVADDSGHLRIEVRDTGIGIPAEKQAGLFEKFNQGDSSTTRKFGGTGLGLAISRQLVLLMGGEIGFSSEAGVGSTFWFTLPAVKGTASIAPAPLRPNLRVLVVDDIEVNRRLLEEHLKRWNVTHSSAVSGKEALKFLEQAQFDGAPFDVAIVDMLMPEIDGEQLAHLIRANSLLDPTRLILFSSSVHTGEDQARLIAGGFEKILSKPLVYPERMLQAISGDEPASVPQPVARPGSVPLNCKVLVVEDNAVNQMLVEMLLTDMGCTVVLASDGSIAVEQIRLASFDIVLMDCQMPVMDGFEATRQIRALGIQTPILALTANAMAGDRDLCLAAGMNDHISKPVDGRELRLRLEEWLGKSGR